MACRHLSSQLLSSRYFTPHLGHQKVLPFLRYRYLKISPWKSMVKAMHVIKGQRSHCWLSNLSIYFLFISHQSTLPFLRYTIQNLPLKIQGQSHGKGQTCWSHLKPRVQLLCLLSISRQLDHFWLRYVKFHLSPWNFKVMVMVIVKPLGQIWGLDFHQYVSFLFCGKRTSFGWDIANSIFDLEYSRSRSQLKLTKI